MTSVLPPILLGADLNCYHMARAFYEAYGVCATVIGQRALPITATAHCLHFHAVPDLADESFTVSLLQKIANAQPPAPKRLVIGCTDAYVQTLARHRAELAPDYLLPYADADLLERLTDKASFAALCRAYDLPHPQSLFFHFGQPLPTPPFPYPLILKPGDSAAYFAHPFAGMRKVYLIRSEAALRQTLDRIFAAGYSKSMILQQYLPGGDDASYVFTTYSDRTGKVAAACFGQVLLEEHTPRGTGNPVAILTRPTPPFLYDRVVTLLNTYGYRGFANFDLRYDAQKKTYYVLELNARQGRSNYYLCAAGLNPARLLAEDLIFLQKLPKRSPKIGVYWRCVPDRAVFHHLPKATVRQLKCAKRAGLAANSFDAPYDLRHNLRRRFYLFLHKVRYLQKYRRHADTEVARFAEQT